MGKFITEGRKLVTIRTISDIKPIENADNIEVVCVDGWTVVSKKNEFKIGDSCLFFEIDSLLPLDNEMFSFLNKDKTYEIEGKQYVRLRTIKLRGQISQGLALPVRLPIDLAHDLAKEQDGKFKDLEVGLEYYYGVLKYEPVDTNVAGNAETAGTFPWFMPKTDEDRIQNVYNKYNSLYKDVEFEATMKLEGSSISIAYVSDIDKRLEKLDYDEYPYNYETGQVIVCSRNLALKYSPESKFWLGAESIDMPTKIKEYCENNNRQLDFQGELMGPGIQGNIEKFTSYHVFVYRVWDIDNQCELLPHEVDEICFKLGFKQTPRLFVNKIFQHFETLNDFLAASEIPSINAKQAEGIVYKSTTNVNGRQIHFKVINNKYLLKQQD